jgi:membrane-associated protein
MVFLGRWTSVLRAIVPGVAGMSRMPYRRFFVFNVIGGVAWATAFTLAGYIAGESYARVEAATGWGSWILGGVLVMWIAARFAIRRRARAHGVLQPSDDETTDPEHEEVLT